MRIEEYTPARRQEFIDLNVWWIEEYFGVIERTDWDEFDNVERELERGGMIFFAVDETDGAALATCMIIPRGNDEWEIAKLGSDPNREHRGYGKAVFEACERWAVDHGARRLYITTNSKLKAAIHIYESHGFVRYQPKNWDFDRGDYALEKLIDR